MAKQNLPNRNTIATITDERGEVILEITQNEYMVVEDGSLNSYSHYHNIQLVDGMAWNPSMLTGNKPVYIGVCSICRRRSLNPFKRRTHGLVSMGRAKLCTCGALCCPKHRRLCSDNKWRCHRCARRFTAKQIGKSILRPIFFKKLED